MDASEGLDRELIVERAEELRSWLADLPLATPIVPLERELDAIIANDPGAYIDGKRPLTGLNVAAFVAELRSPGSGVIGRVRGIGQGDLDELRAALDAADELAPQQRAPIVAEAPAAPRRRGRPPRSVAAAAEAPAHAVQAPPQPVAEPALIPKRRGRPPRNGTVRPEAFSSPSDAPAPDAPAATQPFAQDDRALQQLERIWPALHPHARRAVLLFASTLLAEAPYESS